MEIEDQVLSPLSQVTVCFVDQISSYLFCLAWLLVPLSVHTCWYILSVCVCGHFGVIGDWYLQQRVLTSLSYSLHF